MSATRPLADRDGILLDRKKAAGAWARKCRLAAGLTQMQVVAKFGAEDNTLISQVEVGRTFLGVDRYVAFADAVGLDPRFVALKMLQFTNPHTAALLLAKDDYEARRDFAAVCRAVPMRADRDGVFARRLRRKNQPDASSSSAEKT